MSAPYVKPHTTERRSGKSCGTPTRPKGDNVGPLPLSRRLNRGAQCLIQAAFPFWQTRAERQPLEPAAGWDGARSVHNECMVCIVNAVGSHARAQAEGERRRFIRACPIQCIFGGHTKLARPNAAHIRAFSRAVRLHADADSGKRRRHSVDRRVW